MAAAFVLSFQSHCKFLRGWGGPFPEVRSGQGGTGQGRGESAPEAGGRQKAGAGRAFGQVSVVGLGPAPKVVHPNPVSVCRQLLSYITATGRLRACGRSHVSASHGPVCCLPEGSWGWRRPLPFGGPAGASPHLPARRTERQVPTWPTACLSCPHRAGLRKMLDNFACFGDKLSDEPIFSAFLSIVGKLRRGAKPEGKVRGLQLSGRSSHRCSEAPGF